MVKFYYAGIGSRMTPAKWLITFKELGADLAEMGFILRSGAASGADQFFEAGCDSVNGKKEIYLPWPDFFGSKSTLILNNKEAYTIAKKYHPNWNVLKLGSKKLIARNSHQVLGQDLKTSSDFIVCYTPGGNGSGGTGQAIRIAKDFNIKVFDAGGYDCNEQCPSAENVIKFKNDVLSYAKEIIKKEGL